MYTKLRLLLLACLAIGSNLAKAEAIDWKQAIDRLVSSNPELRAWQLKALSSQENIRIARATQLPTIDANLGYTYSELDNSLSSRSFTSGLSVNYRLFTGYRDEANIERAERQDTAFKAEYTSLKARLSFQLKLTFAKLSYAQAALELQQQISQRRDENLNLVRLRFEGGLENRGSVLLSEAYLKEARFESLKAEEGLTVAQSDLARIFGISESSPKFKVNSSVPTSELPTEVAFEELVGKTPRWQLASSEVELAESSIKLSKSNFFPSLNLSSSFNQTDDKFYPNDTNRIGFSVGLTYPIYNGGADSSKLRQSQNDWKSAIDLKQNARQQILTDMKDSYATLKLAIERLEVSASFREAAKIRADVARTKYNNGLISFEEWDRVETDLILRQQQYLINQRERIVAEASWEQIRGIGVVP